MGLDTVELLMTVEAEFEIEISDQEAEKIITVGQLYDCVMDKLKHGDTPWSGRHPDAVWQRLRAMIAEVTAIKMDHVVRSARFVDDLRMD